MVKIILSDFASDLEQQRTLSTFLLWYKLCTCEKNKEHRNNAFFVPESIDSCKS